MNEVTAPRPAGVGPPPSRDVQKKIAYGLREFFAFQGDLRFEIQHLAKKSGVSKAVVGKALRRMRLLDSEYVTKVGARYSVVRPPLGELLGDEADW